MHEYSVVQALLEQVEELAAQNDASEVTKVIVKIGVMSGVEPHLLEVAFETFKEKSICENAHFIMNIQPLILHCQSCNSHSEVATPNYCCPSCQSLDVTVDDGEDMYLMSLEML